MSSLNKILIIGFLGADPELRYTNSGTAVCSLRIATSETWNDKDGKKQERTEWHSVSVWGKSAEHCGQYLAKGRQVYVEGRLQSREYDDKEGVKRKVWEIQADRVNFLGGGREDGASAGSGAGGGGGGGQTGGGGRSDGGGQRGGSAGGSGGQRNGGGSGGGSGNNRGSGGGGWGQGGGGNAGSGNRGGGAPAGGGGFDYYDLPF